MLNSNDTLEYLLRFSVFATGWDDTRAINEVDTLHESNVLPNFGLSRDRSDFADLLRLDSIDDTALADIGITDEADTNLLLFGHEIGELAEELNEGTFTEGVVYGSVESDGGVSFRKMFNPTSLSTMKTK